jgi:hypothetical protein
LIKIYHGNSSATCSSEISFVIIQFKKKNTILANTGSNIIDRVFVFSYKFVFQVEKRKFANSAIKILKNIRKRLRIANFLAKYKLESCFWILCVRTSELELFSATCHTEISTLLLRKDCLSQDCWYTLKFVTEICVIFAQIFV